MCVTFVCIGKNCVYRRRSGGKDVFPCVFVVYGFILNKVWNSDSDFASYLFVNDTNAHTHTNTHKWRMHVTNTSLLGLYVTSSHIRHWEDEIETKERINRRKQIKTDRQRDWKRRPRDLDAYNARICFSGLTTERQLQPRSAIVWTINNTVIKHFYMR